MTNHAADADTHAEIHYSLTRDLALFASSYRNPSSKAIDVANRGVIDAIGLIILASSEPVVQAARRSLGAPFETRHGASVLFSTEHAGSADGAFINATAAHAFAMDDVAWGCHPSAILFPALLAAGEPIGATGEDVLRAWIVGYEVLAELKSREPDSLHTTGWHPSGLLGPIAVAAAVCNLRKCSQKITLDAIGIAVSMTGGMQVNFGTGTKAIHAGRISSAGVLACDLAMNGVDSSHDALERQRGFLQTISPKGRVDVESRSPLNASEPASLRIEKSGVSIKKYPLCYSLHRLTDAAIDLSKSVGFKASNVESIEVRVGRRQADMAHYLQPQSSIEARYSVPFAVASGLVASAAGFAQLEQSFIESPEVSRLIGATTIRLLDGASDDDPVFSPSDRLILTMLDGSVLDSGEVVYARGHSTLPMSSDEQKKKFIDCAQSGGVKDAAALYAQLHAFDRISNVAGVSALIDLPVAS